jgi:hypothetical protein
MANKRSTALVVRRNQQATKAKKVVEVKNLSMVNGGTMKACKKRYVTYDAEGLTVVEVR